MTHYDEQRLIRKVREGDAEAFAPLVERYSRPIFALVVGIVGQREEAEELTQDIFLKAYTRLSTFGGRSAFSTWLYRIAYNVWYDYTRSHKETQDIDTPAVSCKNAQGAHTGLKMDLLKALQILNENERTCITLQLMDGLSIDKIAEVTGLAQGTIKSHLSRGKQKLASYLKQNGYDR